MLNFAQDFVLLRGNSLLAARSLLSMNAVELDPVVPCSGGFCTPYTDAPYGKVTIC